MLDPAAPQLVVNARTLLFSWLPADPDAVAALLPPGLRAGPDHQVFMNQYVVDDDTQTSGFGAYSCTYLGVCLADAEPPLPGDAPGGWWCHYLTSSPRVLAYAEARGAPATVGETRLEIRRDRLVAETLVDGVPLIRSVARVGDTGNRAFSGHHRYVTVRDGERIAVDYPFVAEPVTPFEIESLEFLVPSHPSHALRPANPLCIGGGFYSPRVSFAYPARPGALDDPSAAGEAASAHHVPARRARSGLPSGS